MPDLDDMRIPVKYLANLLDGRQGSAGAAGPETYDGDAPLHARQADSRGRIIPRSLTMSI
jgi:hypothetical protein